MFKIMNEKAPYYLINLIPKYEPTSGQGTIVYHHINVEQTALTILFFLVL